MTAGRSTKSSNKDWCTPQKYVDAVRDVFRGNIALDPCSNQYSIVKARVEYRLTSQNGLKRTWDFQSIYVNPPYGSDRLRGTTIKDWLKRCADAHDVYHADVIALVPVATNTRHWKDYIFGRAHGICFLADTRLKFVVNGKTDNKGAPMACAMIYWGRDYEKFRDVFSSFGAVVDIRSLLGGRHVWQKAVTP